MGRKANSIKTVSGISVKTGENIADKHLQKDDVFVSNSMVSFSNLINKHKPTESHLNIRRGYEKAIISNGKVVNIVGENYGHLPNQNFFAEMDIKLIQADVKYETRSFNKDDRSFAVDYILNDESFVTKVKNAKDEIIPMIRLVNSYDGSIKTSGSFGFFRKVCQNGLHVADMQIGFSVKHTSQIERVVMPEMSTLVEKFMNNEFYSLSKKFEVMADRQLSTIELESFIENVCENTGIFKFTKSENTKLVGLNVQTVIDTITAESNLLGVAPNLWLGYNSFNEILMTKFDKSFEVAKNTDRKVFEYIYSMAN